MDKISEMRLHYKMQMLQEMDSTDAHEGEDEDLQEQEYEKELRASLDDEVDGFVVDTDDDDNDELCLSTSMPNLAKVSVEISVSPSEITGGSQSDPEFASSPYKAMGDGQPRASNPLGRSLPAGGSERNMHHLHSGEHDLVHLRKSSCPGAIESPLFLAALPIAPLDECEEKQELPQPQPQQHSQQPQSEQQPQQPQQLQPAQVKSDKLEGAELETPPTSPTKQLHPPHNNHPHGLSVSMPGHPHKAVSPPSSPIAPSNPADALTSPSRHSLARTLADRKRFAFAHHKSSSTGNLARPSAQSRQTPAAEATNLSRNILDIIGVWQASTLQTTVSGRLSSNSISEEEVSRTDNIDSTIITTPDNNTTTTTTNNNTNASQESDAAAKISPTSSTSGLPVGSASTPTTPSKAQMEIGGSLIFTTRLRAALENKASTTSAGATPVSLTAHLVTPLHEVTPENKRLSMGELNLKRYLLRSEAGGVVPSGSTVHRGHRRTPSTIVVSENMLGSNTSTPTTGLRSSALSPVKGLGIKSHPNSSPLRYGVTPSVSQLLAERREKRSVLLAGMREGRELMSLDSESDSSTGGTFSDPSEESEESDGEGRPTTTSTSREKAREKRPKGKGKEKRKRTKEKEREKEKEKENEKENEKESGNEKEEESSDSSSSKEKGGGKAKENKPSTPDKSGKEGGSGTPKKRERKRDKVRDTIRGTWKKIVE